MLIAYAAYCSDFKKRPSQTWPEDCRPRSGKELWADPKFVIP